MAKGFQVTVEGISVVVKTAKEAQQLMLQHKPGVTIKEILAGKVEEVVIMEDAADDKAPEDDKGSVDDSNTPPSTNTDDKGSQPPKKDAKPAINDDVEFPEVGGFADEKAMKKFVKKLSDEQLYEWCELEGITWKRCPEHAPIDRMRAAMAIKAKHFPATAPQGSKKSKSKYADMKTEELVQLAMDNDVQVPDDKGDMRILRMYTIMALRKAGLIS